MSIRDEFANLTNASAAEICDSVTARATQLRGKFPALKAALDREAAFFGDGVSEDKAIVAILLSAIWTSLDPYLANAPMGIRFRNELGEAARLLGVGFDCLRPLSSVEARLFNLLDGLLVAQSV